MVVDVNTKPTEPLSGDILNTAENFNHPENKILPTSKVNFTEHSKMKFNQMQVSK